MWQHVGGHAVRNGHQLYDHLSDSNIHVSSTHHQMMRPPEDALIIGTAKEAHFKERVNEMGEIERHAPLDTDLDIEVVYLDKIKSLCFQPHPEFFNVDHPCQEYYFSLLEHFFGLRGEKYDT